MFGGNTDSDDNTNDDDNDDDDIKLSLLRCRLNWREGGLKPAQTHKCKNAHVWHNYANKQTKQQTFNIHGSAHRR